MFCFVVPKSNLFFEQNTVAMISVAQCSGCAAIHYKMTNKPYYPSYNEQKMVLVCSMTLRKELLLEQESSEIFVQITAVCKS